MSAGHLEHVAADGERWDLIAHRYYGDVREQARLLEANRHLFVDQATGKVSRPPALLAGGTVIRVPVLERTAAEANLPPWKRGAPPPPVPGTGGR